MGIAIDSLRDTVHLKFSPARAGHTVTGVLADVCKEIAENTGNTAAVKRPGRTGFIRYGDLVEFSEAVGVPVGEIMDAFILRAYPAARSMKQMLKRMTTCSVSDQRILKALDECQPQVLERIALLLRYGDEVARGVNKGSVNDILRSALLFRVRTNTLHVNEITEKLASDVRIIGSRTSPAAETIPSETVLQYTVSLDISPRWVFQLQNASVWGFKPETENIYDILKLSRPELQRIMLKSLNLEKVT